MMFSTPIHLPADVRDIARMARISTSVGQIKRKGREGTLPYSKRGGFT